MIRRSVDGGTTWETVLHVPGSGGITSIAYDPQDASQLCAISIGSEGGLVFSSRDGGKTSPPSLPMLIAHS